MDVFKLAFETTVVGLLGFLWLGVAIYLLFPDFLTDLVFQRIPDHAKANQTLLSVGILTLAYCLGSAILPIANQLVNDEHWPLPENAIRCQVFTKHELQLENIGYTVLPKHVSLDGLIPVHCSYWAPILEGRIGQRIWTFLRLWAPFSTRNEDQTAKADEAKKDKILSLFQLEESKILNQGTDKAEQLRQLHERIVVLRGAVFCGFVLFLICMFAFFTRVYGHPAYWMRTVCGTLLALCFAVFAVLNGCQDLKKQNIFDIPVLEGLLATIIIFGGILVARGVKTHPFLKKRYLFAVILFASLAYAGWMSSEIAYDQQVISSSAVLQGEAQTQ
jgi:hypothetical protein